MKKTYKNTKDTVNNDSSINNTTVNFINSEVDYEELIEEINQLNISFDTLLVVLLAILLNIYNIYYTKIQALDTLNNTNCAELLIDSTNIPRITNTMFLYTTGVFLEINYNNFVKLNSVKGEERDVKGINKAYRAFFSTLLVLIAAALSRSNLEV